MRPAPHVYPVILAGGASSRLWPASGRERPKWELRLSRSTGGEMQSLLEGAWERARAIAPAEDCYVVCGTAQADRVRATLPELSGWNLLIEPQARDTSGAVAYGAAAILKKRGDRADANSKGEGEKDAPVMLVLPGDHVISPLTDFARCVKAGAAAAVELNALLTFGVVPRRPSTAYGYIHRGAEIEVGAASAKAPQVYKVEGFREKPDRATAEGYLAAGEYFWNSGIFIWQISTLLNEFNRQLPKHAELVRALCGAPGFNAWDDTARKLFPSLVKKSIDYGIMEKAESIATIAAAFQWDDIGSWSSVSEHLDKSGGNAVGPETRLILVDSRNNVIFAPQKRVTLIGVTGLAVVVSDSEILVCRLDRDQEVKKAQEKATGKK